MREKIPYCTSCNRLLGYTTDHGNCPRCGASCIVWYDADDTADRRGPVLTSFGWTLLLGAAALVGCIVALSFLKF